MNKNIFFSIAFMVALIDQATKLIIEMNIKENTSLSITSYFSVTHIKNTGSAFGILQNSNLLFAVLTAAVIIGIIYYYKNIPQNRTAKIGYSFILGGAIGNLVDRAMFSGVTDFIDFRFWPAFNIADSALTVGIALILFYYYVWDKNGKKTEKGQKGATSS